MKSKHFIQTYLTQNWDEKVAINDVTLHSIFRALYNLDNQQCINFLDNFILDMKKRHSENELSDKWREQEELEALKKARKREEAAENKIRQEAWRTHSRGEDLGYGYQIPAKYGRRVNGVRWRVYCKLNNLDTSSGRPKGATNYVYRNGKMIRSKDKGSS
ncbi:MAG: hypothetical protein V7744_08880 [Pseudomonadales bacterium]